METLLSFDTSITLFINGSDSIWLDNFAWLLTKTATWSLLYLSILYFLWKSGNWRHACIVVLGLALCVLVSDQVASSVFKPLVCRLRPTHDPAIMALVDTVRDYRGGMYGFFSSHAANTMSVAVFLSLALRHRATTISLLAWSLINCWTRLYLGVHFFGDILAGLVFGGLVGWCLYALSQRIIPMETRTDLMRRNQYEIPVAVTLVVISAGILASF